MNDGEKDDYVEVDVNIDIEEIMQQIISKKEDNFEQISSNFPSMSQIITSAEKSKGNGDPEATFTQFYRSFPITSEGPPGLNVSSSPTVKWPGTFTKEFKRFF